MSYWDNITQAAQAAAPTGLSFTPRGTVDPKILDYYRNNPAFTGSMQLGKPIIANGYQISPSFSALNGSAEAGTQSGGEFNGVSAWDGTSPKYQQYDGNGNYLGDYDVSHHSLMETIAPMIPAFFAGGAMLAAGGASAGVGGAGGFVGEGAASGVPAWDAAAAGSGVGGAGAAGGLDAAMFPYEATAGGEATGAAGSGAMTSGGLYSPALDSQLANLGIEQAGGDALAGYTAAGIPSVSISNFAASNPGMWDSLVQKFGATGAQKVMESLNGSGSNSPNTPGGSINIPGIGDVPSWLVGGALTALGGKNAADASTAAANTQLESTRESNALLEKIYNDQKALQEPFRQNGLAAGNRMSTLLGIGGDPNASGYGSAVKPFTPADLPNDPGYQFRLGQGQQALTRQLSAGGSLYSGKALKGMQDYTQGLASTEFGDSFNRDQTQKTNDFNKLASVYGSGQTAANTVTSAAGNYGTNVGQNLQAGGNATAAGIVGRSNAYNNAITQGMSMYGQSQMLGALQQRNGLMNQLIPPGGGMNPYAY